MIIYIDESGTFSHPNEIKHSISCIGALIIPEIHHDIIIHNFEELLVKWDNNISETKGSNLNENHFSELIETLIQYDVLFHISSIDMGIHTEAGISSFKNLQAENCIKHISPSHHPDFVKQLHDLKIRINSLSNQLFVQLICLTNSIYEVIQLSTLYYSQRIPETLGQFQWIIDAKDKNKTEYENLWELVLLPFLQSISLNNPIIHIAEGDYSSFRKYENPIKETPAYLKKHIINSPENIESHNIKLIMKELKFEDSRSFRGLQLVDILINCFRRACHGKLQIEGWRDLGKIMVQGQIKRNSVSMICLENINIIDIFPYNDVIKTLDSKAKRMIL